MMNKTDKELAVEIALQVLASQKVMSLDKAKELIADAYNFLKQLN